ncbi:MAG: hypothetical protein K2X27_01230, partial [Candidatus Obscuribacterales bacterium]|nr:hypothetical protein [Candidatus Obscuribacterales bacterium]
LEEKSPTEESVWQNSKVLAAILLFSLLVFSATALQIKGNSESRLKTDSGKKKKALAKLQVGGFAQELQHWQELRAGDLNNVQNLEALYNSARLLPKRIAERPSTVLAEESIFADSLRLLVSKYADEKNWDKVLELARPVYESSDQKHINCFSNRDKLWAKSIAGLALFRLGKADSAKNLLNEVVSWQWGFHDATDAMLLALELSDKKAAIKLIENSQDSRTLTGESRICRQYGHFDLAQACLDRAKTDGLNGNLQIDEKYSRLDFEQALVDYQQGKKENARKTLREFLKANIASGKIRPTIPPRDFMRGLREAEMYEEGLAYARTLSTQDSRREADFLVRLNRLEQAAKVIKNAGDMTEKEKQECLKRLKNEISVGNDSYRNGLFSGL